MMTNVMCCLYFFFFKYQLMLLSVLVLAKPFLACFYPYIELHNDKLFFLPPRKKL